MNINNIRVTYLHIKSIQNNSSSSLQQDFAQNIDVEPNGRKYFWRHHNARHFMSKLPTDIVKR